MSIPDWLIALSGVVVVLAAWFIVIKGLALLYRFITCKHQASATQWRMNGPIRCDECGRRIG